MQAAAAPLVLKQTSETELVLNQLLPKAMVGRVIGKGGGVITEVRQATGAQIKIEDADGINERVATISVAVSEERSAAETATTAAMMIYDKMCESPEGSTQPAPGGVRFVLHEAQVGAVIGKGGSIINQIRQESGALIKVNKSDSPAVYQYQFLDINGDRAQCASVLLQIAGLLMANPPKPQRTPQPVPQRSHEHMSYAPPPMPAMPYPTAYAPPAPQPPAQQQRFGMAGMDTPPSAGGEVKFYLLCPPSQIGRVIGKQGSHINAISQETGATIDISEPAPGSDETEDRWVTITAPEAVGAQYSGAQDALHRVVQKISEEAAEGISPVCKLVAPRAAAGGVIGKGGAVINSIRSTTGAHVNITEDIPSSTPSSMIPAQSIMVSGQAHNMHNALRLVGAHLRKTDPAVVAWYPQVPPSESLIMQ